MLLTGTYPRSLDEKNRVIIPKKLRDQLGEGALYMTPGTDGSVNLYSEEVFVNTGKQFEQASPVSEEIRDWGRLFWPKAQNIEVDRQGRILIPPELAQLAQLQKEIVMLGVRDHVEIWDRDRWEKYLESKQASYDKIAEKAFQAAQAAAK